MKKSMHRVISFTVAVILSTCSALSLLSVAVGALTTTADAIIQSARVYETDGIDSVNEDALPEGLSVFYGTAAEMMEKKEREEVVSLLPATGNESDGMTASPVADDAEAAQAVEDTDSITYMMMAYKRGERVDVKTVEVGYARDVNRDDVVEFIQSDLTSERRAQYIRDFVDEQIALPVSAYRSGIGQEAVAASSNLPPLTKNISRSFYYIGTYTPSTGESHSLMIYFQNIDYDIYRTGTDWNNNPLFLILATVETKPGNELPSSFWEGIENSTYPHVFAVCGAKTTFVNKNPSSDRFINMAPNASIADLDNNDTITAQIQCPSLVDFSYTWSVTTNKSTHTKLDVSFSETGESSVVFTAEKAKGFFNFQRPVLSTTRFVYRAGIYMLSGSAGLDTKIGMSVAYRYVNESETLTRWAGGTHAVTT